MQKLATARRFVTASVVALVVALIATQAIGFRHGIRHADRAAAAAMRTIDVSSVQSRADVVVDHSCAAFDAAALAFAAPSPVITDVPPLGTFARFSLPVTRAPPSATALAYQSRAPPLPTNA